MIEIFEIETFELPDKTVYEIHPLQTEDMDLLLEFMDLSKKVDLLKVKEDKARAKPGNNKEVTESLKFTFNELNPIADKIIDKGTQKQGTEEPSPLPKVYRNISNRIQLTKKIIEVSMGDIEAVGDSPLPPQPVPKSKG
jgi:hypothetical protein